MKRSLVGRRIFLNRTVEEWKLADRLSRVFAGLGDPTRRDIVARLTQGDATVSELAEPYDMSLQSVSKRLRVLEDAEVVSKRREAQQRPVRLEAEVFDLMDDWIERCRRNVQAAGRARCCR